MMIDKNKFMDDVKDHEIQIIRDEGTHRHIRFKKPDTNSMYFDLITWPGHLCFSGDMGTNVFSRIDDMFEFFRSGPELSINAWYWSEKLLAVDGNRLKSGVTEFDKEEFKKVINEARIEWIRSSKESGALNECERRELWEAVDDEVLGLLDDDDIRAQYAAYDFNWRHDNHSWQLQDLFEHNFTGFTIHFVWCCYAIAWGIQQYDLLKRSQMED